MDRTDDLWTAIRGVLPDADELAAAVADELGEPLDDVRLSVLIGTIALKGQLGPEAAVVAAIETELGRLQASNARGRQVVRLPPTRSTAFWPRLGLARSMARLTLKRSCRSSALQERSRRGPTARSTFCCTATRSRGA